MNTILEVATSGIPCPTTPSAWPFKLLGLIITIAAISQGTPFWFESCHQPPRRRAATGVKERWRMNFRRIKPESFNKNTSK
jgi:hypothetical protein